MGTVPTARTFVAGETETAAYLNSVSQAVNFILDPPRCRAYPSAATSVANVTYVAIPLDTEVYDTDNIHATTNNTRFTCQTAGLYLVVAQMAFATSSAGVRLLQVRLNGSANPVVSVELVPTTMTTSIQGVGEVQMNVGDYIELYAYQSSGGALNVNSGVISTFLDCRWVARS